MPIYRPLVVALACLAVRSLASEDFSPVVIVPSNPVPAPSAAGDELALFADLPVVVAGSRRSARIVESPVAISVVTADDIHYGGYDQLADALYFVPGVDVAYTDRGHPMVGVRGLHETFSDRTLLLLDGQVAENPLYGGGELARLPVLSPDIDHIEIVRGPGGAAWGANALNGVINVVTRAPESALGTYVTGGADEHGDVDALARWGDFAGPVRWRLSIGGESRVDAETATGDAEASPNDESQRVVSSGALTWDCTPTTQMDLRLGYGQGERGALDLYQEPTDEPAVMRNLLAAGHLRQALAEGVALTLGTSATYYASEEPTLLDYASSEIGYTGQLDLDLPGNHRLSLGADSRFTHLVTEDEGDPTDFVFTPPVIDEYRLGLYIIDRWQVTSRVACEAQLRGDTYSGTGRDWAGRVAVLTALDDDQNHVLRLSTARAYRAPLSGLRQASADRVIIPGLGSLVAYRTEELDNEHTWSLELGWTSHIDAWTLQTEAYYQHYDGLIGYDNEYVPLAPGIVQTVIIPRTLGDADAHGIEVETGWTGRRSGITVWYAWNWFAPDADDQSVRGFLPAEQKVGVRSRWRLLTQLIGIANYRYSELSESRDDAGYRVDPYHRLDLALTWQLRPSADVTAGCHDVFDDAPQVASLFTLTPTALPGRTWFLRGDWSF